MDKKNKNIIIGSLKKNNRGAIPTVTYAFIDGLKNKYNFIPHYSDRKYGTKNAAKLNIFNLLYFVIHLVSWIFKIIRYKPQIAHYPVTSFWNLEKSLIFLKIARFFNCKTIGHLHGGSFLTFWDNLSKRRKKFATYEILKLNGFIVLSKGWKKEILQRIPLKEKKVFVINNPIDKKFENAFKEANYGFKNYDMLSIGVMSRRKGIYDILGALNIVKGQLDNKIYLVGPEREKNINKNILYEINRLSLERIVSITGPKYDKDKIELFRKSSIFILPSYSENFPLSIIEAACAGLAIITSPVGAIPEYFVNKKSALLVKPGSINEIKDSILMLLNDSDYINKLGLEARKIFEKKFKRNMIINNLDNVYKIITLK